MNKKTWIILGVVAGVLLLCLCLGVGGFFAYQTIDKSSAATEVSAQLTNVVVPTVAPEVVEPTLAPPTEAPPVEPEPTEAPLVAPEPTEAPAIDPQATAAPAQVEGALSDFEARMVASDFLRALSDQDYDSALSLTYSEMRNSPDAKSQLIDLVETQNFYPDIWEWTDVSVEDNLASMTAVINFVDGRRGSVELQTTAEEGSWFVNYIHFTTDGEPVDPGALSGWSDQRTEEELAFATSTADYFLFSWLFEDWQGAYDLCAQPMKDDLGGPDKIQTGLGGIGATPESWTWDSHDFIEVEGQVQPVIELSGVMQYEGGVSGPVLIQLMWEDGYWSVLYIDVKTQ